MTGVELWCRVTVVGPAGAESVCRVLKGQGDPDLGAVDDVARLALQARRLGGGIVLAEVSPALQALLELAGLRVEVEGQAGVGAEASAVGQRVQRPAL